MKSNFKYFLGVVIAVALVIPMLQGKFTFFDEEKLVEFGESCYIEQSEIIQLYSSFKKESMVRKVENINSILMTRGKIESIEGIVKPSLDLVFE